MKVTNVRIFFLFFAASFLLYFIKISKMAAFDADQEFFAYQYVQIVKDHKLTLLGIQTKVYLDTDLGLNFGFDYLFDYYCVKRADVKYDEVYQIRLRQSDTVSGVEFKEAGMPVGIKVVRLE